MIGKAGKHQLTLVAALLSMLGPFSIDTYISSRLAHLWSTRHTITLGFGIMILAAMINLGVVNSTGGGILGVIGPLVLYVVGLALMMPAITVLALDCLPSHRGTAASVQGFLQMTINAMVSGFAVPLLHTRWRDFVSGQLLFLLVAVMLWYRLRRNFAC